MTDKNIDYAIKKSKEWYWFKINNPDKNMELTVSMFTIPWEYDTTRMKRNCCIRMILTNKREPLCDSTFRYNDDEIYIFGIIKDIVKAYDNKIGNDVSQVVGILSILEDYKNYKDHPFHNVDTMLSTLECITFIKDYFYDNEGRVTKN